MIYRSKIHDLTATLTYENQTNAIVELTVGSETRRFRLGEFTDFLLAIVEEDRKIMSAYLDSLEQPPKPKDTRETGRPT